MEKKNEEEAKNVPKNVKVVIEHYFKSFDRKDGAGNHFFKIDSITQDTVEIKTQNVKKTKDSVKKQNKIRRMNVRTW